MKLYSMYFNVLHVGIDQNEVCFFVENWMWITNVYTKVMYLCIKMEYTLYPHFLMKKISKAKRIKYNLIF